MPLCVPPWVYPVWDSALPGLECFKFLSIISSNIFSGPFSLSSFWDPYNVNVGVFNVVPEVSETVLISFHSFFFILFHSSDFHQCLLAHFFVILPHLFCY